MSLESRIATIEERNRRVESDKAWETSWVRRLSISLLTYLVVGAYLMVLEQASPWLMAIVPATGYFLSTLALSLVRSWWQTRQEKS